MNVIDLNPSFYCLYIKNHAGEEQMFLRSDITPSSERKHLDLFENEAAALLWIKEEQAFQALNEYWSTHAIYDRLYTKKIFVTELARLMAENEAIDSITMVSENGVRRLYFRDDLAPSFDTFFIPSQKVYPKEPIYIINRQRELDEKTVLQKEAYFVTYPEVAIPLFSLGIKEWADDLIDRKPNQGYYIEETTLYNLYQKEVLDEKGPDLFILSREDAPHYILRKTHLKQIIEDRLTCR